MSIALLGLRIVEISDTGRKHLGEIMSLKLFLKRRLNLYGIGSAKSKKRNPLILFITCLSMIEMSRFTATLLMHWQIPFLIILHLLSAQMHSHQAEKQNLNVSSENVEVYYTTGPTV